MLNIVLSDLFSQDDLDAAVAADHVVRRSHPTLPLTLYSYSRACQYDHIWTPVTTRCRGLIVDNTTAEIVALPFPKMFVSQMHGVHPFAPPLPDEPFTVYDKVDGSLIIIFHYDGNWHVATKGSFISVQADYARKILSTCDLSALNPNLTYLAEAVYPDNRIVVDYGDRTDLVLLGAYSVITGLDALLPEIAPHWKGIGSVVKTYDNFHDIPDLESSAASHTSSGTEEEGWVVRYESGLRVKIKFADYLRLHKLFTRTNEKTIWEVLAAGHDPSVLFDTAPDEFADYVHDIADSLRSEFADYVAAAQAEFDKISYITDRKTFASHAVKSPYRAVLFNLFDGQDFTDLVWKYLKPKGSTPYMSDLE